MKVSQKKNKKKLITHANALMHLKLNTIFIIKIYIISRIINNNKKHVTQCIRIDLSPKFNTIFIIKI